MSDSNQNLPSDSIDPRWEGIHAPRHPMRLYESLLAEDQEFALSEGSKHFEGQSAVQSALHKIAHRLEELKIPYAVAGGMALFSHGLRRFTEDVDILVSFEGLQEIHQKLDGLGYVTPFEKSKNLRDAENAVRIEFLISGQYPGDGKPKPVSFPNPQEVAEDRSGIKYLNLNTLVELKLASGMTNPQRLKDLADVQELIKILTLPGDFANQLNPFVQPKYHELWQAVDQTANRFVRLVEQDAISESKLLRMKAEGLEIEPVDSTSEMLRLSTTDPELARKYGLHDESEAWEG